MSRVRLRVVSGSTPDVYVAWMCEVQLGCLRPCCGLQSTRSGCLHTPSAIMAHSSKAMPDQGYPHLSLGKRWPCKGQCHTDAAGPDTGDSGMHPVSAVPCHLQATANTKAQFTPVNLTCMICSLALSTWHRKAHIYFQLFYLSEVTDSTQTAFWGWCLAHTNPLAVLAVVVADFYTGKHQHRLLIVFPDTIQPQARKIQIPFVLYQSRIGYSPAKHIEYYN